MKNYQGFLIDLDGTVYKGTEKNHRGYRVCERIRTKGAPLSISNK